MTSTDYDKLLLKLDRLPSAPNWVRFVKDDAPSTAKEIIKFLRGRITFTYQPSYAVIKDCVELGLTLETAIEAVLSKGAPSGRSHNAELVTAFYKYQESRNYQPSGCLRFGKEYFRISRDLLIPVSPLSVIRENGKFLPIFLCGWAEVKLTDRQRRLLATICEDAFLSLTDFMNSPAEFLFFPRLGKQQPRTSEVWQRGDYKLLSDVDLRECVEIYLAAREIVRKTLIEQKGKVPEHETFSTPAATSRGADLFSKLEEN